MGSQRAKQTSKLKQKQREKYDKENRNFTPEDLQFIVNSVPSMTVEELADKMDCTVQQIETIIKQYNATGNHQVKSSYVVPGRTDPRMKGIVIGTQASSQLSDKTSGKVGIQPKVNKPGIFEQPK